jgi:hypothetical protein
MLPKLMAMGPGQTRAQTIKHATIAQGIEKVGRRRQDLAELAMF